MSHYNTTNEQGRQLNLFQQKAHRQQDAVHEMFRRWERLTASECLQRLEDTTRMTWILTSVRRAITDLTNEEVLIKTDVKRMGLYGRPEYQYKLK